MAAPVQTEDHEHVGGENVAPGPDHHQHLAQQVGGVPLKHKHILCLINLILVSCLVLLSPLLLNVVVCYIPCFAVLKTFQFM